MTIKASRFTPEVLISGPRLSREAPTDDASMILYEQSKYSFEDQKTSSELRMFIVPWAAVTIEDSGRASNPVWLDRSGKGPRGGGVLFLREREDEKGVTDLFCFEDIGEGTIPAPHYLVGTFPGPVDDLKVTQLGPGHYGIAVTGKANPDGSIYNANTAAKPKSTASLYNSLFVRHWDEYITPQRNAIFHAALLPEDSDDDNSHLFMTPVNNAFKGTGLESPMPPFGGADHFDIGPTGLVFVARDPSLDPALHTKCNVYLVPLSNFSEDGPSLYTVKLGEFSGAMSSPRFNADGSKVVFLAMREDGYEADRNEIFVIEDTTRPAWITQYRASHKAKENWDRSPDSIQFSPDGESLWVTADNEGKKMIFRLPVDTDDVAAPPYAPFDGSVSDVIPLKDGYVFGKASTLVDSAAWIKVNPGADMEVTNSSSLTKSGRMYSLQSEQYSSHTIPSPSSVTGHVQYWEIRPSDFDTHKRYPLALLIHGGPQGAWNNAWSTRWNPAVFAEQGYVVVCPNITGSTGFGQAFADSIEGSWGGRPFRDLGNVFEHFEKNVEYVDTNYAVALGASYGGFMVNWIQGHDLGRKFKALVCHDGVFSSKYELATDELYFINHEFLGPWDPSSSKSRKGWSEYDPAEHTDAWATPQLVIHSEKDYRLTMADGLAAFNVLQSKGVESAFLTFSDENHFVSGKENSLRWHEAVLGWINEHVGLPKWERKDGDVEEMTMDRGSTVPQEQARVKVAEGNQVIVRSKKDITV